MTPLKWIPLFFGMSFIFQTVYAHAVNISTSQSQSTRFLSVGDWGSASLGGYHLRNAQDTATAMKTYVAAQPVEFVLNTGDNFYYCGIQNTSDPQIDEDYTALFGGMGIQWYHSLGNHDYGFSPEAQLALNETISGWIMDGRYYHRRVVIPVGADVHDDIVANIIVLDTNPCVRDYRGTDRRRWDPCGTEYPDCSPIAEPCRFHENILSQDCETQLSWAKQTLAEIPSSGEWVFVIGHHKAEEINVADFQTTFLDDPRVHLYLNGHNHNLEHYEINGQAKYMTTGAGGMVIIGGDAGGDGVYRYRYTNASSGPAVKSLWSKVVTGFSSHTFTNNSNTLLTEFWDVKKNETIYTFEVHL
jgi:hypothetical protein